MISLVNCNHQMLSSAKISIPCLECRSAFCCFKKALCQAQPLTNSLPRMSLTGFQI